MTTIQLNTEWYPTEEQKKKKKERKGYSPERTNNGRRSVGKPCQNKPDNEQSVVNVQEKKSISIPNQLRIKEGIKEGIICMIRTQRV